jgi:hypothetical protein
VCYHPKLKVQNILLKKLFIYQDIVFFGFRIELSACLTRRSGAKHSVPGPVRSQDNDETMGFIDRKWFLFEKSPATLFKSPVSTE